VVDSDIFSATTTNLRDIRIFDDRQAEVPYQIETEMERRTERVRRTADTTLVSAKPDGQKLEVRIKLPVGFPAAEALVIATPLMNYERTAKVEGSVDGTTWKVLVPSAILFDYSKYMDVSNREIPLPKNSDREFKLTFDDLSDERLSPLKELTRTFREGKEQERIEKTEVERRPFRIDRISAVCSEVTERIERPKTTEYELKGFDVKDDAATKRTLIDVTTRGQPVTEFTVGTTNRNFSRRTLLDVVGRVEHPPVSWTHTLIATTTLSRVRFGDLHRDETTIAFPERRNTEFQVEIANEDNPPLKITDVRARGPIRRLLFLAEPGRQYRVEYGSESAKMPSYETAAVLAKGARDASPTVVRLGAQVENAVVPGTPPVTNILSNPWFLGCAIGVMVVVLGWCLLRAGKKLDALPKEGETK
ncbi:MAG TPA: hypothetical protein VHR72_01900, partial [Gemmataceae bacterium]|nr:hypothetical protein [Gemmataceae bacterium]